jgi:hypothetical protein
MGCGEERKPRAVDDYILGGQGVVDWEVQALGAFTISRSCDQDSFPLSLTSPQPPGSGAKLTGVALGRRAGQRLKVANVRFPRIKALHVTQFFQEHNYDEIHSVSLHKLHNIRLDAIGPSSCSAHTQLRNSSQVCAFRVASSSPASSSSKLPPS